MLNNVSSIGSLTYGSLGEFSTHKIHVFQVDVWCKLKYGFPISAFNPLGQNDLVAEWPNFCGLNVHLGLIVSKELVGLSTKKTYTREEEKKIMIKIMTQ